MAENQNLRVNIIGDASKLNQALGKAEGKLRTFSGKLKNIGRTLTTRVTLPLAAAGGAAIKLASDMEESMNKVDVSFGKSSEKVKEFAKTTLTQFGIAEGSALEMTSLFGDMATGMGVSQEAAADMSIQLAGLAGDLASFKNIRIDTAQTALAAIFTGETESLKRLGVVMTQANLDAFALTQGITKQVSEMTEAEKINLRLAFVMDRTRNAQGDFARTSGGAANQMRIFQESLKEVGAELGKILLPAFTEIVKKTNNILKKFRELSEETKELIVNIGVGTGLAGIVTYIVGFVLPPFLKGLRLILSVFTKMNPIVAAVTAAISAFGVGVNEVAKKTDVGFFETLKNILSEAGALLGGNVIGLAVKQSVSAAKEAGGGAGDTGEEETIPQITKQFEGVSTAAREVAKSVSSIVSQGFQHLSVSAGGILTKVKDDFSVLGAMTEGLTVHIGEELAGAFQNLTTAEKPLKALIRIIKNLIVRLVAAAAAAAVLAFLLPGGGATKAARAATFIDKFRGLVGLANGGIAFGQTPVMVGDYSGVRSNPEVIAPLNKLQSMIGGSQNVTGEFVLRGQDLIVALQRAEKSRNRTL